MSDVKNLAPATLTLDGKTHELPVVEGTERERGVDISGLLRDAGAVTLDPGYGNTGSCLSDITYIDGNKGILRYRGYPIEELAEKCYFVEVAYLLIKGNLPDRAELERWRGLLTEHSMIHEDMRNFFRGFPERAHPMAILSAMVVSLSTFYPELLGEGPEAVEITAARLISKVRTIAAYSCKKAIGEPYVYPRHGLRYCANFLHMMFDSPCADYQPDPVVVKALEKFLILHADHEQNCSTSTVRLVGSSEANLYASISAGVCALWGKLHGGANQAVIEMLEQIHATGGDVEMVVRRAKDKDDPYRLFGFGHRVYKTYDPRARIAKQMSQDVMGRLGIHDPLLDIALQLEKIALEDDYFVSRNLYPNVDFYTGITLRAMGIPTKMYPVMFAIGRLPGWIAQYLEMRNDPARKIGRPRQIYVGPTERHLPPIDEREPAAAAT